MHLLTWFDLMHWHIEYVNLILNLISSVDLDSMLLSIKSYFWPDVIFIPKMLTSDIIKNQSHAMHTFGMHQHFWRKLEYSSYQVSSVFRVDINIWPLKTEVKGLSRINSLSAKVPTTLAFKNGLENTGNGFLMVHGWGPIFHQN